MNNQKIVYITGCLGFIGAYITRNCLDEGWFVRGVDKVTYAANKDLAHTFKQYPNFILTQCDINNLTFLYDCDYVINCAAESHVANSIVNSQPFVKSNIYGVYHLLELIRRCREESRPTLLHFSTDEVYGDIHDGYHTEKDLLKPSNPYSATKASADMLISAWHRTHNVPYIIVRPSNNYGVGQYIEKLIPKTVKFLNLGRKIPLHNYGTPVRNWLHAQDTADAIVTIIKSGNINEIYNIAGHFEQNNWATVTKILAAYYNQPWYESLARINNQGLDTFIEQHERPGQDVRYAIDDTKLRNLGWFPQKKFDEELPGIVDYYKERFIW